jgi:hypothetical protein
VVATDSPSGGGCLSRVLRRSVRAGVGVVGVATRFEGVDPRPVTFTCICGVGKMVGYIGVRLLVPVGVRRRNFLVVPVASLWGSVPPASSVAWASSNPSEHV